MEQKSILISDAKTRQKTKIAPELFDSRVSG
jgi:hypothetical protein